MKNARIAALLATLIVATFSAHGQAIATATRMPVQVGAGYSFGDTDYGDVWIKGFSIYADYTIMPRISIEADIHQNTVWTPQDIGESSYLVGPRYNVFHQNRATIYGKVLAGAGQFHLQPTHPNPYIDTHLAFAFGGGIEFRATQRINARPIDVEYQYWPNFRPHGLTPWVVTTGAAYMF